MLKDCVNVVTLNNPPYIPIPFSNALVNKLFKAKKLAKSKPVITILENNIDLSRLKVTAFETNKEINKEINIKRAQSERFFFVLFYSDKKKLVNIQTLNLSKIYKYTLTQAKFTYYFAFAVCISTKLFSIKLTKGTIIKKCEKYKTVLI